MQVQQVPVTVRAARPSYTPCKQLHTGGGTLQTKNPPSPNPVLTIVERKTHLKCSTKRARRLRLHVAPELPHIPNADPHLPQHLRVLDVKTPELLHLISARYRTPHLGMESVLLYPYWFL